MRVEPWSLPAALGIAQRPELVALVGGGGKTSLMFALASALRGRVIMTTTTRIFAAQMRRAPVVVYENDLSPLSEALAAHGQVLVVGNIEGEKALGVRLDLPARLLTRPDVDHVLVEADGSRMRPVKAPAEHEPAIPDNTTLLVPVAGIEALEGLIEDVAHRPERVREIANDEFQISRAGRPSVVEGRLTATGLARVLAHPRGGLKNAPPGARVIPFLNKVDTVDRLEKARETAAMLLREPRVQRVVIGTLHSDKPVREVWRRVTALVLAAGESRRMGRNKLLLPWDGTTVLERTLAHVARSGVSEIITVVGHERALTEKPAQQFGPTIFNKDYVMGMLSSVQTAIQALSTATEAVLVVLGDQPLVEPDTINALLTAYAATPRGLVAPTYHGQRGNPVIIDRRYFAELLALPPDAAPRVLLQRHPDDLRLLEIDSDAILHDLDRPEDYERLKPEAKPTEDSPSLNESELD